MSGLRIFSLLIALLTGVTIYNPRAGEMQLAAWGPKLLADALAPLLALLGGMSAFVGLKRRDPLTIGAGAAAAVLAAKHIAEVTAAGDDFSQVFGPDWESRIPPRLRARFAPRRWQPIARNPAVGPLQHNVSYGLSRDRDQPLLADVMQPPTGVTPTGLAMIYVHGGAWLYGRKNIGKFPMFRQLAAQGHLIMDIDYTLAPHTSVHEMVIDVKRAVLWLKQRAANFNLNPDRIVVAGQSAGAQLALLTAYTPNHPTFQPPGLEGDTSVRAVVSFYGPPDMAALYDDILARFGALAGSRLGETVQSILELAGYHGNTLGRGVVAGVVGNTPAEDPGIYRLLSPVAYAGKGCPPTLLFQGTHDLLVDFREVERFHQRLRAAGVPAIYVPLPGCDHAFDSAFPRVSPSAQTATYYLERFLALML